MYFLEMKLVEKRQQWITEIFVLTKVVKLDLSNHLSIHSLFITVTLSLLRWWGNCAEANKTSQIIQNIIRQE